MKWLMAFILFFAMSIAAIGIGITLKDFNEKSNQDIVLEHLKQIIASNEQKTKFQNKKEWKSLIVALISILIVGYVFGMVLCKLSTVLGGEHEGKYKRYAKKHLEL